MSKLGQMKEYRAWVDIRRRCYNPKRDSYAYYGARGISVCPEWKNDFRQFLADVGYAPSLDHSIERIDVDGDYEPGNVRWATIDEQNNNQRRNVFIEHLGRRQTVAQWAAEYEVEEQTLRYRLRIGWSIDDALNKPSRGWRRLIEHNGEHRTEKEWSAILGIPATTIRLRRRQGKPIA